MIKLENYPKTKAKLMEYSKGLLAKFQQELLKDAPAGTEAPVIEETLLTYYLENILTNNIRSLYDFFDSEELNLLIDWQVDGFVWYLRQVDTVIESKDSYKSRIEAEAAGFEECFKIYENG